MKQYGWFRAMVMSFYSRNLYRDVAQNWGIGTFFYLFLLLAICWSVLMFHLQPSMNFHAAQAINDIMPQLPEPMKIKDGKLVTPENKPYIISDSGTKEVIAIIDTSGKYTDLETIKTPLLITQDKIFYAENNSIRTFMLPANWNTDIIPAEIKDVILKIVSFLWIILLPIFLIGSFLYRIFQSVFYALIGKLFAVFAKIEVSYVEVVKLAMVAISPAIIISTVLQWNGLWFTHSWLFFVLSMGYLIFAIHANKNKL